MKSALPRCIDLVRSVFRSGTWRGGMAVTHYDLAVPADARSTLAAGWLMLGLASLIGAGVFSILLVLARTPYLQHLFPSPEFFRVALILHVDLSVLVWFLALGGVLWSVNSTPRMTGAGWAALGLAAAGTALMGIAPFASFGVPIMSNYVPVLDEPWFLSGLAVFGAGFLVLALRSGAVRTIFVEVSTDLAPEAVQKVTVVLNERLAGLSLKEIRATLAQRLRDASPSEPGSSELLNIFIQEAEELFEVPVVNAGPVHLGSTQPLAGQPEFSTRAQLQGLLDVTERRDLLRDAITARGGDGLTITIGQEHADARLSSFTLVTSTYRFGPLTGVIGVMGPTRMAYDKIAALVNHTSQLVGELLE